MHTGKIAAVKSDLCFTLAAACRMEMILDGSAEIFPGDFVRVKTGAYALAAEYAARAASFI
jgi:hypothetical protein